jgi:hypothetical protein
MNVETSRVAGSSLVATHTANNIANSQSISGLIQTSVGFWRLWCNIMVGDATPWKWTRLVDESGDGQFDLHKSGSAS